MPRPMSNNDAERSLLHFENNRGKGLCPLCCRKCCLVFWIILFVLLILCFTLVFVGFPVVFMNSISLQRSLLFMPFDEPMGDYGFDNVNTYLKGSRNLYVTVNSSNINLGVWHILPEALLNSSTDNPNFNYSEALMQSDYPVVMHFHGNGANRIYNIDFFYQLRKHFHVIAFDYRGYGDSSKAELTEEGIVQDCIDLYKWLLSETTADIYIWGHSLGAAVGAHTAARLKDNGIIPAGLILEAPYTNLREEAQNYPLAKIFTWLPWFDITILDPLEKNGFLFKSDENILNVDCPIMVLHAEDDSMIPVFLGQKLAKIATEKRDPIRQGNVTLHVFPAKFGYNHMGITSSPEIFSYIRDYIGVCQEFKNKG